MIPVVMLCFVHAQQESFKTHRQHFKAHTRTPTKDFPTFDYFRTTNLDLLWRQKHREVDINPWGRAGCMNASQVKAHSRIPAGTVQTPNRQTQARRCKEHRQFN